MSILITPLTPAIGAEISNVDLQKLDDQLFAEIKQALLDYSVIFFRDQPLTPEQQLAFGKRFGEVEKPHPFFMNIPELPQVSVLENHKENPPGEPFWHTDTTWKKRPAMATILYAKEVPQSGGDTVWASMEATYEMLSEGMKTYLSTLTATHNMVAGFMGGNFDDDGGEKLMRAMKEYPAVTHPVIRTHPVTGKKCVFVNPQFTTHINGVSKPESNAILGMLHELAVNCPLHQIRFHWEANSIAIWDNRCTQHYPVTDYYPQYRRMHRVTIVGDVPF